MMSGSSIADQGRLRHPSSMIGVEPNWATTCIASLASKENPSKSAYRQASNCGTVCSTHSVPGALTLCTSCKRRRTQTVVLVSEDVNTAPAAKVC